tara:strand:+ start:80 stop:220 length:141 start_codon:yes stop_codon:yes gene_type:complete
MTWKEEIKKSSVAELEKIIEELGKAVEMHESQAKRIKEYLDKIKGD